MNKKIILIFFTVIIIIFSGVFVWRIKQKSIHEGDSIALRLGSGLQNDKEGLTKIQINNKDLWVEIASTSAQKAKGLSGKQSLAENTGLLFTYEELEMVAFWMKDMLFPIDIIWIADNQIIGIEENVLPPTPETLNKDLPRYRSSKPVDRVLETNAGWCRKNNVKVGSKIAF